MLDYVRKVLADKEECVEWKKRQGKKGRCVYVCVSEREREKGSKVACCIRDRLQHPRARGGLSYVNIETKKQMIAPLSLLTCRSEIRVNESDKKNVRC